MNNSLVKERAIIDTTPQVRKAHLGRWIEVLERVSQTADWKLLEGEFFSSEIDRLERLILQEARKTQIDSNELYKLQGRLSEAKRHSLKALLEDYKLEFKSYG